MQFDAPETPAQAKAREIAAQAQRKRAQRQADLAARATKGLTGNSADVGQGQLFESDLFSGPTYESHQDYSRTLRAHKPVPAFSDELTPTPINPNSETDEN